MTPDIEQPNGFSPRLRPSGSRRPVAALLLGLALAAAALPAPALAKPRRATSTTGGSGTFVKVATHPQAAAQPTALGKTIATLKVWNGKLYTGYGDYGANTGPIAITPYDGATFAGAAELQADSEAVWIYREIGGKLYAPSIDPRVSSDFAVGTSESGSPSWLNPTLVPASHVFDVASLDGSDLWLVGSQSYDAVAWRSLDGGSTWTEALRVPPMSTTTGDFARFYGAAVSGGKLYVQAMDNSGGLHPHSAVFDGAGWSDGPSFGAVFNHAEAFGGQVLFDGTYHSANYVGALWAFDGTRSTAVYPSIYDYTISGNTVYVLGTDGRVKSSQDLRSWTDVGTAPSVARSIAVLNGVVYLGGTDSAIYRTK